MFSGKQGSRWLNVPTSRCPSVLRSMVWNEKDTAHIFLVKNLLWGEISWSTIPRSPSVSPKLDVSFSFSVIRPLRWPQSYQNTHIQDMQKKEKKCLGNILEQAEKVDAFKRLLRRNSCTWVYAPPLYSVASAWANMVLILDTTCFKMIFQCPLPNNGFQIQIQYNFKKHKL